MIQSSNATIHPCAYDRISYQSGVAHCCMGQYNQDHGGGWVMMLSAISQGHCLGLNLAIFLLLKLLLEN